MDEKRKGIAKRCSGEGPLKALPSGVISVERVEKIKSELKPESVHVPPFLYRMEKEDDKCSASNLLGEGPGGVPSKQWSDR